MTVPVMQDRDQKRPPPGCGRSPEEGEQGLHSRQRLACIMRCQRLGELTELGAGNGTLTTDVLDQGSNGGRAFCCQAVFSHEPTQNADTRIMPR